jgi:phosphoadenosine phosphosulfate reductase
MTESIAELQHISEGWSAERVLEWAFRTYGDSVAIASAFGAEGMVLVDLASRIHPKFRLFTLDTDFFFQATYELMQQVEAKYGISIEREHPRLTAEEQTRQHGLALWRSDPDRCCAMRKIEPLRRKLSGLQAWITAIRRDQTADRARAGKIEWDEKFGLVKINPLADWSSERVWQYIREREVPYNPLHDVGYRSIGCTHCTRAVLPGEDERDGRWSGLGKTECGLHILPAVGTPDADAR